MSVIFCIINVYLSTRARLWVHTQSGLSSLLPSLAIALCFPFPRSKTLLRCCLFSLLLISPLLAYAELTSFRISISPDSWKCYFKVTNDLHLVKSNNQFSCLSLLGLSTACNNYCLIIKNIYFFYLVFRSPQSPAFPPNSLPLLNVLGWFFCKHSDANDQPFDILFSLSVFIAFQLHNLNTFSSLRIFKDICPA